MHRRAYCLFQLASLLSEDWLSQACRRRANFIPLYTVALWRFCLSTAVRHALSYNTYKFTFVRQQSRESLRWNFRKRKLFSRQAQLSQKDRATLHVIEYLAKSLIIDTQGHSRSFEVTVTPLRRSCMSPC